MSNPHKICGTILAIMLMFGSIIIDDVNCLKGLSASAWFLVILALLK
jgi:hypothetical protein